MIAEGMIAGDITVTTASVTIIIDIIVTIAIAVTTAITAINTDLFPVFYNNCPGNPGAFFRNVFFLRNRKVAFQILIS